MLSRVRKFLFEREVCPPPDYSTGTYVSGNRSSSVCPIIAE